ncbi:MAG: calcium-binding protein, partial [Waterburya sp.]
SSQYTNPNGMDSSDQLSGTEGTNTFNFDLLLNAKPEIYQKHVDSEGKIDWEGVTGENGNYHDHWVEGIGEDTIMDFSGSGGEGDKIQIDGHTVTVKVLEELDNQATLGIYSDQGADGTRGNDAHDFDVVGKITINHDGNFNFGSDVSVNAGSHEGVFEFA